MIKAAWTDDDAFHLSLDLPKVRDWLATRGEGDTLAIPILGAEGRNAVALQVERDNDGAHTLVFKVAF